MTDSPFRRMIRASAPDFWRLWIVGLVVFTVRWLETVAVGVVVYQRTESAFLVAMIEDPEWIRDMVRVQTDVVLRSFEGVLAKGVQPDGLWIYGDMAYNHATMCSPAMYRELVWPAHKRMADWAHARGMRVIYHTDGRVSSVLDLYIAAGFECLQPIEAKAGMDVRHFAPTECLGHRATT